MTEANPQSSMQHPISLTETAISVVKQALVEENLEGYSLRIAVRGGGCSGLQYALDFTNTPRTEDVVLNVDGLQIVVDFASAYFLKGTQIDYLSSLEGSGFKFNNPNIRRTCSCSHSR